MTPRRAALVLVVTVVGVVLVQELADATRNEDDVRTPGSVSEIVIDVRARRVNADVGAQALWAACHTTVSFADIVEPLARIDADDAADRRRYALRVSPALGENDRRRLRGCLEDGTVDRVWGSVVSITASTE